MRERAMALASHVKPYLYELPDRTYARVTEADYDALMLQLPVQMDNNYYAYYDSLETPWPFHILAPETKDGKIVFSWEDSYILEGDYTYTVEVARSWDFKKPVAKAEGLTDTEYETYMLSAGQYFLRVSAVSSGGLEQKAYEYYNTEKKTRENGVLSFYVLDDGTVVPQLFDE